MRCGKAAGIAITLFALLTTLVEARADTSKQDPKLPEVTILSTMVANLLGVGEWGFSALLEFEDETILFDTGFKSDTVSKNATLLGKDLSKVTKVILTHFHSDHTGGLLNLRRQLRIINPDALSTVYVGEGFFRQRYDKTGNPTFSLATPGFTESFRTSQHFRSAAEALGITFVVVTKPTELRPGVFLTGAIPRVHDERNVGPRFFLKDAEGGLYPDTVPESQVLGLQTKNGWMLISGCGHAGIVNASDALRAIKPIPVEMIIGGLHLFKASDETIRWTGKAFKRLGVEKLVGAHCTGVHATYQLAKTLKLPRSAISVGAIGTRIDASLNIVASSIE